MSTPNGSATVKGRPARKVVTENWDDDFEFSLPNPKGSSSREAAATAPKRDSLADCSNVPKPHDSPDSFMEDWDEPLPSRSLPTSPSLPPAQHHSRTITSIHSPRVSPSQSTTLQAAPPRQISEPPPLCSASINSFRAAVFHESPVKRVARQPSTHFTRSDSAELASQPPSATRISSPHLPSEPRTPTPSHANHRSAIRNHDDNESKDSSRKPKFWNRFSSGAISSPGELCNCAPLTIPVATPDRRRPRSSSVGGSGRPASPHFMDPDAPPVPSLPPNHRSSSTASQLSSLSTTSSTTSAGKSSPTKRLSKMMRRSSSNLSATLRASRGHSPLPSPLPTARDLYLMQKGSSQTPLSPEGTTAREALAGDTAVCPGLSKSNSEGAPDGLLVPVTSRRSRPLSHQSQVHGILRHSEATEGETKEAEERRVSPGRRKHRPPPIVSPPRHHERNSDVWAEQATASTLVSSSTPSTSTPKQLPSARPGLGTPSGSYGPSSGSFALSAHTTLNRITSFSKKHGRRLSGGWKFGTASSAGSAESKPDARTALQQPQANTPLEPVEGSPSKPMEVPDDSAAANDIPSSQLQRAASPSSWQFVPSQSAAQGSTNFPEWQTSSQQRRSRKERRRASLNDFVIPDRVLAAQKGLRRDKVAIKEFAEGVQVLQSLMQSHDRVCDYILAKGSRSETKLFAALENEYGEWLEWASLLIDIGSTGTEGHGTGPDIRTRRITLAAGDAHRHSEALRSMSGGSVVSSSSFSSSQSGGASDKLGASSSLDGSTVGHSDLSKRQLEMLHKVLDTPGDASVASRASRGQAVTPSSRISMPARVGKHPSGSPDDHMAYDFPSPTYPSPSTADHLARQQPRRGLSGIRDLWRGFKNKPVDKRTKHRPVPIDLRSVDKYGDLQSPPVSPLPSAGPPSMLVNTIQQSTKSSTKKRRPSVRQIFRHGSGNWGDIVRSNPPPTASPVAEEPQQSLPRPPSVPALARLNPKGYPGLGLESPAQSPTHPSFNPSQQYGVDLPPIPTSPSFSSNGDATIRQKSRILGLGHPLEGSPSRASSSPARVDDASKLAVEEVPLRSRSDGAKTNRLEITPENLPGLLEQAKECERMLGEWRVRAAALGSGDGVRV